MNEKKSTCICVRAFRSILRIGMMCLIAGSAYAQYPIRLNFGAVNAGENISFNIQASINKPSMGMQTVTYRFVNNYGEKVSLNWITTLKLSGGKTKVTKHSANFGPGETKEFGWGSEGDIVDIKRDGGEAVAVSLRLSADDNQENEESERQKMEEETKRLNEEAKAKEDLRISNNNKSLKQQVQTAISDIPTPNQRSELHRQYQSIVAAHEENDPQLTILLENLLAKAKGTNDAVNTNLSAFNANKEKRLDQIDDMEKKADDINRQQAEILGGLVTTGAVLAGLSDVTGSQFRYRGPSYKLGLKLGLNISNQPFGQTQHDEGSYLNTDNGQITPINESEFSDESMFVPGIYGAVELSPYYSNTFSISAILDGHYNYYPTAYDPGSDAAGNQIVTNSYNAVSAYSYAIEAAYGKKTKLLLRMKWESKNISSNSQTSAALEYQGIQSESLSWHKENQDWKSMEAVVGLRFGDYTAKRYYFDIGIIKSRTTRAGGFDINSKFSDLFSFSESNPWGLYMQYAGQSGWTVKGQFMKNPHIIDAEGKKFYYSTKVFVQLTVCRGLDFFGKPYHQN